MRAEDYLRASGNLTAFAAAFANLVAISEPDPQFDRGVFPLWRPMQGREDEANKLMTDAARTAGPAAHAFDLSGISLDYKPSGTWQRQSVNPALVWFTMFQPSGTPMLDPSLMAALLQQALGILENEYEEQEARQRGVIGALAWFFTLAPRVREAAGLPRHSAGGTAVTWLTVLAQGLIVTVVGGLLVGLLAALFGLTP